MKTAKWLLLGGSLLLSQAVFATPDNIKPKATEDEYCDKHPHKHKSDCDPQNCDSKRMKQRPQAGAMQPGYHMPRPEMLLTSGPISHMRAMNLSDEQDKKLEQLETQLKQNNQTLLDQQQANSGKLRELHQALPHDVAAIKQTYQKIFETQQQMIVNMLEADNQAFELLNAQQREQFTQNRQKMMQRKRPAAPANNSNAE